MILNRIRLLRYFLTLIILILFIHSIRKILFVSHSNISYNGNYKQIINLSKPFSFLSLAEIQQNVPNDLRHIILKSSSNYTIKDLLNITNFTETFQEFKLNSSENSIHLITQWYHEIDRRRRQEVVSVLHMNVINNAVTKIHFIQNSDDCTILNDILINKDFPTDLLKSKLIIYYDESSDKNQRLKIDQALEYANRFISKGYAVLINVDVFFDQSLLLLKYRPLLDRKTILYLSRYEVDPSITTLGLQCSSEKYVGSHDAFIFQTPLSHDVIKQCPFEIGTWHIEVKIIHELLKNQYTVRNTCKSIRLWHLHSSQVRHRLMPSKKYIPNRLLNGVMRYPEFL